MQDLKWIVGCTRERVCLDLQVKFPSQYLSGQCDVQVRQVLVVCLEDERSVIQQVLEESNSVEDSVAFFLSDRPVQLRTRKCFAEEADHMDFAIGHHVYVSANSIIGGIRLLDRSRCIVQEVQLLVVRKPDFDFLKYFNQSINSIVKKTRHKLAYKNRRIGLTCIEKMSIIIY